MADGRRRMIDRAGAATAAIRRDRRFGTIQVPVAIDGIQTRSPMWNTIHDSVVATK